MEENHDLHTSTSLLSPSYRHGFANLVLSSPAQLSLHFISTNKNPPGPQLMATSKKTSRLRIQKVTMILPSVWLSTVQKEMLRITLGLIEHFNGWPFWERWDRVMQTMSNIKFGNRSNFLATKYPLCFNLPSIRTLKIYTTKWGCTSVGGEGSLPGLWNGL